MSLDFDGVKLRLALPKLASAMVAQVDGESDLAEIGRNLGKSGGRISSSAFMRQFETLYAALNGINAMLFIRGATVAPGGARGHIHSTESG